jgi:hypothetical protein
MSSYPRYGSVQLEVLHLLREHRWHLTMKEIAEATFGPREPTANNVRAVRAALARLIEYGDIQKTGFRRSGEPCYRSVPGRGFAPEIKSLKKGAKLSAVR